ncbi:MAG: hypothetical protein IJL78_07690 [Lachnospiraceae bacterium]|nr:hypothetical protein [Lachnospiraceae bacterium]
MTEKHPEKSHRKGWYRYLFVKSLVRLFYPKITVSGAENLPEKPALIIGNHCHMNGPITAELYMPRKRYTWCASEMMDRKEVPAYAFQDFWSEKPKWTWWFYKAMSHLIAPLSEIVFTNADTIAVYHDRRVLTTLRETAERLEEGADAVIFPEHHVPYGTILYEFQEGFVETARIYFKKTGRRVSFVPFYIAPALKRAYLGTPVVYDPENPPAEERRRITKYLMEEITRMAEVLPRHRVVPYPNIPKKEYPYSR